MKKGKARKTTSNLEHARIEREEIQVCEVEGGKY